MEADVKITQVGNKNLARVVAALMVAAILTPFGAVPAASADNDEGFTRIATWSVYQNNADPTDETVAEIVAVSPDGMTLAYTDGEGGTVGFVDITDPTAPVGLGTVDVGGEPTSVAFKDDYALVAVNTSESFTEPSGELVVVSAPGDAAAAIVTRFALIGQPDSIAVAPAGAYAAIVIENERDEDLGDGEPPQAPGGALQVVRLTAYVGAWEDSLRTIDLIGLPDEFGEDPEPEFVDINRRNQAVVSFQENNHLAVFNLWNGGVVSSHNAGTVDLENVDTVEDDIIRLDGSLEDVPREPDSVAWMSSNWFATANEGDLFGGSRGFSIFGKNGRLIWDSGSSFEHLAVQHGHYPEGRSENKGAEPEAIAYDSYGDDDLLFVGSERGSFVAVYDVADDATPTFNQFLPTGLGPEGILTIPERNLLVVSSEVDEPPFGVRSTITIYERGATSSTPDIISGPDSDGLPIPWSALSGLASDPGDAARAFAVWDSFYSESRIFTMDLTNDPAVIDGAIDLTDAAGEPVAYDQEGVALADDGGFWIASEGSASVDEDDPTDFSSTPNLLVRVDADGVVQEEIGLPADVAACREATIADLDSSRGERRDVRFGFEGVTVDPDTGVVWVATQREWVFSELTVDGADCAELSGTPGVTTLWGYDPADGSWRSVGYELAPKPENASWVGLSEITALGGGEFVLIERDNRTGDWAEVKTITKIAIDDSTDSIRHDEKLVFDLLPAMRADNGWISDKPEGLAVTADGEVIVVTDNDGVDDWSGETQLLRLGALDDLGFVEPPAEVSFATFNASLNRGGEGELAAELAEPGSEQPAAVAEIIQRSAPDVVLINEFDYDAAGEGADLFQANFLGVSQNGADPIEYPYVYSAPSNTGIDSGLDLDNSGDVGGPNDGYGFGFFPGQFGMVVYSKYPIDLDAVRTFRNFLWSDMPEALLPDDPSTAAPGDSYTADELAAVRLSSKSHWDLPVVIGDDVVHVLASHPTPPVFDGDEDRNGTRNHDEIRFWADYVAGAGYIYDDAGSTGGLSAGSSFVIMGDLNADPFDGDSTGAPALLLTENPLINNSVIPSADGGVEAAAQGEPNEAHLGDPSNDTADFGEAAFGGPGNLRVDYVLPSADLDILEAVIYWPSSNEPGSELTGLFPFPASDHRLVAVTAAVD